MLIFRTFNKLHFIYNINECVWAYNGKEKAYKTCDLAVHGYNVIALGP